MSKRKSKKDDENKKPTDKKRKTMPDKKEKKSSKKKNDEDAKITVVCRALHSALHPLLTEKQKADFVQLIQELALTFGRLRREVTLLANGAILQNLQIGQPIHMNKDVLQQFYKECMAAVIAPNEFLHKVPLERKVEAKDEAYYDRQAKKKVNMEAIQHFCRDYWLPRIRSKQPFPYEARLKGLSIIKDAVARELATAASNSLFVPFLNRQRSALRQELYREGLDPKLAACVARMINNSESNQKNSLQHMTKQHQKDVQLPAVRAIILKHRQRINLDNKDLTESYLEQIPSRVLRYYSYLAQFNAYDDADDASSDDEEYEEKSKNKRRPRIRSFSLLPVCHYSMSSVPIQKKGFRALIKKLKWDKMNLEQVFNLNIRGRSLDRFEFANSITTDGVKVSLLFKTRTNKIMHKDCKRELVNILSQKTGTWQDAVVAPLKSAMASTPIRVIGVDPGRKQLVTVYDPGGLGLLHQPAHQDHSSNFRHFSKKRYYHESGVCVSRKRQRYWETQADPETQAALKIMAQHNFKIANLRPFLVAWQSRARIDDLLWTHYGTKRFRKLRFLQYQGKQSALDHICKLILGIPEPPRKKKNKRIDKIPMDRITPPIEKSSVPVVVAYGNGRFPTAAKGQAAGPLGAIVKRLHHHARIVMVNEYRTSKVCSNCQQAQVQGLPLPTIRRIKRGQMFKTGTLLEPKRRPEPCWYPTLGRKRHWLRRQTCDWVLKKPNSNFCGLLTCSQALLHLPGGCDYKYRNRDRNAARNIRNRLISLLQGDPMNPVFRRPVLESSMSSPLCIGKLDSQA